MIGFLAPAGLGLLLLLSPPTAQPSRPAQPNPARLKADLEFLAGPDLAGRETGSQGATRAAAYLAEQMRESGLEPIRPGGLGGVTPYHYAWTYQVRLGLAPAAWSKTWGDGATDVVGVIPGRDPALTGEYVFVTAHFDHLGAFPGGYYPGADDNASGTVAMLEAMRLLAGSSPRRSIAFLGVSGEEEGLLGSEAYLAKPPVPVATIKADINMDMVGRGRPGELHLMPARLDGQVSTLAAEARATASALGLPLAAGIDQHWQQSDQFSFATRAIPSICFNTGMHPDYHQPSDTSDKIDYGKLVQVVSIIRELTLKTANADAAPAFLPRSVWESWEWAPYTSELAPEPGS